MQVFTEVFLILKIQCFLAIKLVNITEAHFRALSCALLMAGNLQNINNKTQNSSLAR